MQAPATEPIWTVFVTSVKNLFLNRTPNNLAGAPYVEHEEVKALIRLREEFRRWA